MQKLTLDMLAKKFKLEIKNNNDKLDVEIKVYGFNRAGLELAGYFEGGIRARRVVLMSSKEYKYIMTFNEKERTERYTKLLKSGIPGIVLTPKFKDPVLFNVAKELKVPVLISSETSTSNLIQNMLDLMDDYFAPTTEVHASLVNIFGIGVLITGESGIGKSELTVDLVKRNHLFVGDDRIILTKKDNRVFGKSHEILSNLVEVRGIGIVNVADIHGYQVIMNESPVDLIINLEIFKSKGVDDTERLGNSFDEVTYLGVGIPHIKIPISPGRNTTSIVETAVAKLKLSKAENYVEPSVLLEKRIKKFQEE